jgi:hypothetical protein
VQTYGVKDVPATTPVFCALGNSDGVDEGSTEGDVLRVVLVAGLGSELLEGSGFGGSSNPPELKNAMTAIASTKAKITAIIFFIKKSPPIRTLPKRSSL